MCYEKLKELEREFDELRDKIKELKQELNSKRFPLNAVYRRKTNPDNLYAIVIIEGYVYLLNITYSKKWMKKIYCQHLYGEGKHRYLRYDKMQELTGDKADEFEKIEI